MKRIRFLSLLLVLALVLSACGGSAANDAAPMEDGGYALEEDFQYVSSEAVSMEKSEASLTTSTAAGETGASVDRKLIKTLNLNAETEHFDDLMAGLDARITDLGGYVESRESQGQRRRSCSMTVRIPAARLGAFTDFVGENANVTYSSETTEDITLQYVDTETKITALETEQARLLELLEGAQNISEILEIEARLSEVTYELERYSSRKRTYDNLVDYATVHLNLQEVEVLTPVEEPTVWQRISGGFTDSLEDVGTGFVDLFVFLTANSPRLLVLGLVIAGITALVRKRLGFRKKKKAPLTEEPPK